jgi:hypothetical protein
MKTLTYTQVIDRSEWPEGPWDLDPLDKVQWRDPVSGLPVMIKRGPMGAWCGYVGIEDPNHPWFEKGYQGIDVQVHGGLSFSEFCDDSEGSEGERICHVTEEGDADKVWWLGFDTGHFMDMVPQMMAHSPGVYEGHTAVYKDKSYITREVLGLASQVVEASQ